MYELPDPEPKHLDERLRASHAVGRASRDAEVEALNAKLTYANEVIDQRNAEIKRGHDDFIQAVTDPENQPSQFWTVTPKLYEALKADAERYRAIRNPPYSDNWGDLYAMTFQRTGDLVLKGDELDKRADQSIAARAAQEK